MAKILKLKFSAFTSDTYHDQIQTNMASLRRIPKSPYWIACFKGVDGKPKQRSTKVTDRNDAMRIALKFEETSKLASAGLLVENQARRVITEIYQIANRDPLRSLTINDYLRNWLASKALEAGEKTHTRYSVGINNFLKVVGAGASKDLVHLSPKMIKEFREARSSLVTAGSINTDLKILRAALNTAKAEGLILTNPCDLVPLLKQERFKRRPFTIEELKKVLSVADDEWRGIILFGVYTGARLTDIVGLKWANLSLQHAEVSFTAQKTSRHQVLPLARPLLEYLNFKNNCHQHQPIFPSAFALSETSQANGALSKRFTTLLVKAGLRKKTSFPGKGRNVSRVQYDVCFHSLRHTAASLLRNSGVSDVIAKEILGHESDAAARNYSHIEMDALRKAVEVLPRLL